MRAGTTQLRGTSREGHTANRRRGWIGQLRSTTTQRAEGTARLITTIAVIVALIGGAGPAAAQVLVSNLFSGLSIGSEALGDVDFAQPFTTGTNASGYQLESISINFQTGRSREHEPVYVYLYGDHGNGSPNDRDQIATLTKNGATFEGPVLGVNKYKVWKARCYPQPPHGGGCLSDESSVHLDANTQYWVFVWAGESKTLVSVDSTGSNETGAAGWSIGDSGLIKPKGSADSNYTDSLTAMRILVEGTPNPEVLISISDATATEGTDATMDFVVSLSRATSGTVTVEYLTIDGTALAFHDYQYKEGTLTFQPGETSKTVSVPIINDAVDDSGETFQLVLVDVTGADIAGSGMLGGGTGTGTIFNTEGLTGSFENVPGEHDGLTGSFEGVPEAHDGQSAFSFRVAFSEDIGISYKTLRDESFTTTGGAVTGARRVDGRNDLWEITVKPSDAENVTITLPRRDCGTTGAVCTREDTPRALTNSPSATVAGPPGVSTVPVTASFGNMPAEHDGSEFTFDLSFSENVAAGYARIRDHAFSVNGANIKKAQRKTQGSNQNWTVTVDPTGNGGVSITLPETTNCHNAGAICTDDGRKLNHSTSDSVQGPVGISVSDARVEEAAGAVLAFAVTLSRSASSQITINYATSDGSATAGADYTAASGILTIESGSSSGSIEVTVLDDSHNEDEETMTLRLSNPSGGVLTNASATGTIENSDPMPRAFMARFGRTAAVHVVEQVQERIEAPREVGFEAQFAGRQLRPDMVREMAVEFLNRLAPSLGANRVAAGVQHPMSVSPVAGTASLGTPGLAGGAPMGTADELLGVANPMGIMPGTQGGLNPRGDFGRGFGGGNMQTGSAFVMNHETRRGGILSFWSRGAQSQFYGREGKLSIDGRVRTAMAGADYQTGPLVAGLSLSHSRGRGGYQGVDIGEVSSSVTGLYPWLGYQATDRISLWGVSGYGKGSLTLTPGAGAALRSGLSMAMAAGGMRGELADSVVGGFGLAFKADALWVGTGIKGVDGPEGRLAATDAMVTRYRTALEASRGYSFQRGLSLQPSLEVGVRRDGGDAENGAGVDLGGGLIVSDRLTGLSADIRVRMLLAHQDEGFRERGMSVSFSYNPTPSTPLGFMAKLTPSWGGQVDSGSQALWGQETMAGMAQGGVASGGRLQAELGYGMPVWGRLVGTPSFGIGTSEHGRDFRLGYGLTVAQGGAMSFDFGVYANRRESPIQGTAEHGVQGRLMARW